MTSGSEQAPEDPRIEAALARNHRYLFEFVEALSLCPWARHCREMGRLTRRVILDAGGPPGSPAFSALVDAAMTQLRALAAMPETELEIGLLIFPALTADLREGPAGAHAFELLCAAVREAMQCAFANQGLPFYCVAFHPELGLDLSDENRAVRFIRRSPDPTFQLVRIAALEAARGPNLGDTRYVDPATMSAEALMAYERPLSISERITRLNWETLQREGPAKLLALLDGISQHGR